MKPQRKPKPNLLDTVDRLLGKWRGAFAQKRTFLRAHRLALGMLVSLRRHLISNAICATGRQFQDWSSDYRLAAASPWDPRRMFDPVLVELPRFLADDAPVLIALDDTLLGKTGRKIPGVSIARDPMSPPFHVNLCYGLRFVQASALVYPSAGGAARALPVRFEFAPPAVKPKAARKPAAQRSADAEGGQRRKTPPTPEQIAYREEHKRKRLTQVGVNTITDLRYCIDKIPGLENRQMIVTGDTTYTTAVTFKGLPERTTYIGRIRKNAKLHWPVPEIKGKVGRPRKYGPVAPTPEQVLNDDQPWITVQCFVAGQQREIPVKTIGPVYWRAAGVNVPLRLVVIKPPGYRSRKGGKLHYRQPAFLICTDLNLPLQLLVQAYLYRWEIECNHRDEKSLLGVGQGQVRTPDAVRRLPQFQVATYSILLTASLLTSGFHRGEREYLPLPKWRRLSPSARPSLLDLLNLLRDQIFARNVNDPIVSFEDFLNEAPASVKSSKLPLSPENTCTLAA